MSSTSPPALPGVSGHLVSQSYLAKRLGSDSPHATGEVAGTLAARIVVARRLLGPASSVRSILELAVGPLLNVLGFDGYEEHFLGGPLLHVSVRAHGQVIVVVVAPFGDRLDSHWRAAVRDAQQRDAAWCLLFNGTHVRIVDASRLYARRWTEFELQTVTDHPLALTALSVLAGSATLGAPRTDPPSLHRWIEDSDRDAATVCRSLRDGVVAASADVLGALVAKPRGSWDTAFDQALTIVYRVVFLLFAEARSLVPVWHPVYRDSYSIDSLRQEAERASHGRGLWDALRAIGRLAHAGCRAGDLRVTAFNGRLFAPGRTPLAERRGLDPAAARRAVLALATRKAADGAGRERIAYADLGVEQLGAVYETLLDYRPATGGDGRIVLERGSDARKATGTFYTPQTIANVLARRTLGPLVHERSAEQILALRVVDPAMGSGACLVAACRFLASAYEQALIAGGQCHASDIGETERTAIRRLVTERCLYGVDLNPMAVQLARLSLWLTSLAADRPLSFLDHRLASGDSLLGAWLSTLRHAPGRRRRPEDPARLPLFADDVAVDALQEAVPIRFSLESIPNDTVEQVRAKERALAGLGGRAAGIARWKRVADLWCAIWFAGSPRAIPATAFGAMADAIREGSSALPRRIAEAYEERARAIATARRFFHWELEFPEVFFDGAGERLARPGFDAVIGNPPWDMMRADAGDAAARQGSRSDVAAAVRFTRDAGLYRAQSDGQPNRYQLFVERAVALTRPGGRVGLVLPWGLAADHGSAALRRHLLSRAAVDMLVGIDNQRGIFPIHRSVRFLLATATAGVSTERIACRFGVTSTSELESIADVGNDPSAFPMYLSPATLERLSGSSLAIPYVRTPLDLAICEKAAALHRPIADADGWAVRFGRELNATEDRDVFRPAGRGLPVVDGKHLEPFRVAAEEITRSVRAADARRLLGADRVGHPRLGYRDVASATNRQTLIAAVLPAHSVSTHTVFCLRTPLPLRAQHLLCGFFNSFVVNYLVRLRVTTHVTTAIVGQLPIPVSAAAPAACREIAALARLLARRPSPAALARLNALVARLYQLTQPEFEHVLATFPLVDEHTRHATLAAFLRSR